MQTEHVIQPVEVMMDGFAENVFQLTISYYIPEPLPEGAHLNHIKHEVNMHIYDVISKYNANAANADIKDTEIKEEEDEKESKEEEESKDDSII